MDEQLKVLIDWLSVSSKIHSADNWRFDLGIEEVTMEETHGYYGYRNRLYFDGIAIHYNPRSEEMGTLLEMSGQGCRNFESSGNGDYERIFADVRENIDEMNITRFDIACDDTAGFLPLGLIAQKVRESEYVARFQAWEIIESNKGVMVQHGSSKSDVLIRIYDKARERGHTDGRHWVRCELQLRRELARNFAVAMLDGFPVGKLYAGVVRNYLRYIEPDNAQKTRCRVSPFWANFLDTSEGIRLYEKPGVDYNVLNLESYIFGQAGNSIHTYIEMFGFEKFLEKLREKPKVLSQNQRALIAKYGRAGD